MDLEAAAETAARLKRWEFCERGAGAGAGGHRLSAQPDRDLLTSPRLNASTLSTAEFLVLKKDSLRALRAPRSIDL
jgi:hypothetical protein